MAGQVAKIGWRVTGLAVGLGAASVTRTLLTKVWAKQLGGDPPTNPASRETTWPEALAWAAASGVAITIMRMVAARGAAGLWEKATGSLPPGMEEVTP